MLIDKTIKTEILRSNKSEQRGKYIKWLSQDGLLRLQGWARDGLTDAQIAENIGINRATLYEWKNKYSCIADALKENKEIVDRIVENALYKAAIGYDYQEDVVSKSGEVIKVIKHMPANTTAQIFWLKNRKREEWRDKIETSITGKDGGAIQVQALTEADIDKRIAELKKVVVND